MRIAITISKTVYTRIFQVKRPLGNASMFGYVRVYAVPKRQCNLESSVKDKLLFPQPGQDCVDIAWKDSWGTKKEGRSAEGMEEVRRSGREKAGRKR